MQRPPTIVLVLTLLICLSGVVAQAVVRDGSLQPVANPEPNAAPVIVMAEDQSTLAVGGGYEVTLTVGQAVLRDAGGGLVARWSPSEESSNTMSEVFGQDIQLRLVAGVASFVQLLELALPDDVPETATWLDLEALLRFDPDLQVLTDSGPAPFGVPVRIEGAIRLMEADGALVFHLPSPTARDEEAISTPPWLSTRLELHGRGVASLSTRLSVAWLRSPARVLPVRVERTVSALGAERLFDWELSVSRHGGDQVLVAASLAHPGDAVWQIDWGDGQVEEGAGEKDLERLHVYEDPGVYALRFQVCESGDRLECERQLRYVPTGRAECSRLDDACNAWTYDEDVGACVRTEPGEQVDLADPTHHACRPTPDLPEVPLVGDAPAPFNKDFLDHPQAAIHWLDLPDDVESPPLLDELVLADSVGGVVALYDDFLKTPGEIIARLPVPGGLDDVLTRARQLSPAFGVTDFDRELELVIATEEDPGRGLEDDVFPPEAFVYLQHVCRDPNGEVLGEVLGSGLTLTWDPESQQLTRISNRFVSLDCPTTSGSLSEADVRAGYPGIVSDLLRQLLPPETYQGQSDATWVWRFATASTYYEVAATDGSVLQRQTGRLYAQNVTREVYDRHAAGPKPECRDLDPSTLQNGAGGTGCTGDFLTLYDTLYWASVPWAGISVLSFMNGSRTALGLPNKAILVAELDSQRKATSIAEMPAFATAPAENRILLTKHAETPEIRTRIEDPAGKPLPGLPAVVDLLGHEVGHAYIAAFINARFRLNPHQQNFVDPAGAYQIGTATGEGFADIFGELAEGRARYEQFCRRTRTASVPNCGEWSSYPCGSARCGRGEYCADAGKSRCQPCRLDCPDSPLAARVSLHASRYLDGNEVFRVGKNEYRDLFQPKQPSVICPAVDGSRRTQLYTNSRFLSSAWASYHFAPDPLFQNRRGFIRNIGDIKIGERIAQQMLRNLKRHTNSVPELQRGYLAAFVHMLQGLPSLWWNQRKINAAVRFIYRSPIPRAIRGHGRCDPSSQAQQWLIGQSPENACSETSRYICTRTKGR